MGHHKDYDELREDRFNQDERRQEVRDEVIDETGGDIDDLGSQDERRKEGRDAPDPDDLFRDNGVNH